MSVCEADRGMEYPSCSSLIKFEEYIECVRGCTAPSLVKFEEYIERVRGCDELVGTS